MGHGVGDVDEAVQTVTDGVHSEESRGVSTEHGETLGVCSGGGMPVNTAVSFLLSDAGLVVLRGEQLAGAEAVALNVSLGGAGVVLDAVLGSSAQDIVTLRTLTYSQSVQRTGSWCRRVSG